MVTKEWAVELNFHGPEVRQHPSKVSARKELEQLRRDGFEGRLVFRWVRTGPWQADDA